MKTLRLVVLLRAVLGLLLLSPAFAGEFDQRVQNLSNRAFVGTGENILISGFVVGQGARKPVLIRAIGPTLSQFQVPNPMANPVLRLFNSSGLEIASNDDWSADSSKTADLNAAFTSTGAFALNPGSQDAALMVTLSPGAYTAQVSGSGNLTGEALMEIYDLSGPTRLMNLSGRALVNSGAPQIISGLVVGANSVRKVLIRAAGPSLTPFGVTGALSDPVLDIRDKNGVTLLANNDWEDGGKGPAIAADAIKVGAFAFTAGSKDAAVSTELNPGIYTVIVSGYNGGSGVALVEVYDLNPDTLSTVSVVASIASADTVGAGPGRFTFSRTGDVSQALTVDFQLTGNAVSGTDYVAIPAQVSFPSGIAQQSFDVAAIQGDSSDLSPRSLILTLVKSKVYGLGDNAFATVTLFRNPGTLYLASLRPFAASSGASLSSGTATIQLAPDESYALVSGTFSNLSSAQVSAHLAIGAPGETGPYVFTLTSGQFTGLIWNFKASGIYSSADLKQALKEGRIYVSIDSANFPSGELRGQFILSAGSFGFVEPAAPPALPDTPLSAAEASRFLAQTTFGPTLAEVGGLTGAHLTDLNSWITSQMARTPSNHRTETMADFVANTQSATVTTPQSVNRLQAWWKFSLNGNDHLRQRVAFALSQIFVVSEQNNVISNYQEGMANYYDMLANDAFGTYRQLLEHVALSPIMGSYLSHLRNRKADPKTGSQPDENFAREIMQLFSIGLIELQPDGTVKLSADGLPIPTYNNTTITEVAKVFTGFSYYTATPATTSFTGGKADYINPMTLFPAYHDSSAKTIVSGRVLPAGQDGLKDLSDLLDTLANHPNAAPFISKQLIQRLVSSNPSPAYVRRVTRVFEDNGSGVRGDLGAVVRAILLDYEARSSVTAAALGFGKLREPLLRTTGLLRAFSGANNSGRFAITNAYSSLNQGPLQSPTVFNFFEPAYVLPGALAAAGLVAPEYQILTGTTAISTPNYLYSYLTATRSATTIALDLSALLPFAKQSTELVDFLNVLFCAGTMPTAMRTSIVDGLSAVPSSTTDLDRVRFAIYLTLNTPEAAIQR